jgi:molybdopterin synthase sulfur carrier subunit
MAESLLTITIKLFAAYQEAYGQGELIRSFAQGTVIATVLDQILQEKPELEQWRKVTRFARNYQFVEADTQLEDGDEVVLIPPVSGG